ncbi:hypothetical protein SprV_1002894600 [Sparganum proliferum]
MYVRQDEAVFCTGGQEEQFVIVKAMETRETQNSFPGSMVCADACDKITTDKSPSRRLRGQECVQFRVESVSRLVGTAHRRSVDTDKGGNFSTSERSAEAHQAIVDALRQTGQSSHDVVPDGEGDTRVSSLCPGSTVPKGVAVTHLLQLALFGESGL